MWGVGRVVCAGFACRRFFRPPWKSYWLKGSGPFKTSFSFERQCGEAQSICQEIWMSTGPFECPGAIRSSARLPRFPSMHPELPVANRVRTEYRPRGCSRGPPFKLAQVSDIQVIGVRKPEYNNITLLRDGCRRARGSGRVAAAEVDWRMCWRSGRHVATRVPVVIRRRAGVNLHSKFVRLMHVRVRWQCRAPQSSMGGGGGAPRRWWHRHVGGAPPLYRADSCNPNSHTITPKCLSLCHGFRLSYPIFHSNLSILLCNSTPITGWRRRMGPTCRAESDAPSRSK